MSTDTTESPVLTAVRTLERELETARRERDEFRDRWLKQVDANDKLRGALAHDRARVEDLESMCRE